MYPEYYLNDKKIFEVNTYNLFDIEKMPILHKLFQYDRDYYSDG